MARKQAADSVVLTDIANTLTNSEILELSDLVLRDEATLTTAQIAKKKSLQKKSNNEVSVPFDDPE